MKTNYRIKQTVKIENIEENPKKWPQEGSLFPISENGTLLAKIEVKQVDKNFIYGQVTNTYGHKRRKNENRT